MRDHFDIKICGLSTEESVAAAINAGATMIGLIFVQHSPRFITADHARMLTGLTKGEIRTVGLFADEDIHHIKDIIHHVSLDHAQIHGQETHNERMQLIAALPNGIFAKGIQSKDDLPTDDTGRPYRWLFDARAPQTKGPQGGHGQVFDWSVLKSYNGATPFLLAGGLTPGNVAEAVRYCADIPGFSGVDVSSGVESSPGVKDPARIAAFVEAVHAARADRLDRQKD